MLARTIPQEISNSTHPPDPLHPPDPPPDPPSTLPTRPRVGLLVQSVGLRRGQEGAGTPSPSTTPPSAFPLDARHCAMPAIAEFSADLANLVGDIPTAANSRIHSLSGSTATPRAIDRYIVPAFDTTIPSAHVRHPPTPRSNSTQFVLQHFWTHSRPPRTDHTTLPEPKGQFSRGLVRGRLDHAKTTTPGAPCTATYPPVTDYCRCRVFFRVRPSLFACSKFF